MNINNFKAGDCFPLLDLEACVDFKTETSISFQIGRHSKDRGMFSVRGWLDVHHPVAAEHGAKAILRIALPAGYFGFEHKDLEHEQKKAAVTTVLKALGIPPDEVYEAFFFTPDNQYHLMVEEPGVMYTYAS